MKVVTAGSSYLLLNGCPKGNKTQKTRRGFPGQNSGLEKGLVAVLGICGAGTRMSHVQHLLLEESAVPGADKPAPGDTQGKLLHTGRRISFYFHQHGGWAETQPQYLGAGEEG